jgi:hypothetical protein
MLFSPLEMRRPAVWFVRTGAIVFVSHGTAHRSFAQQRLRATLASMDTVRFGRALGFGARQAVKTLVNAVDAATATNPSATHTSPNQTPRSTGASPLASGSPSATPVRISDATLSSDTATRKAVPAAAKTAAKTGTQTPNQSRPMKQRLGHGSKRFGEAVWRPFVRLSGVLWLEVTGVFFGLFALIALSYLWKLRAAWHTHAADNASRHALIGAAIMFLLFGYFCVSSFLRARRRERRR